MKKCILTLFAVSMLGCVMAQMPKCGVDTRALVAEQIAAGDSVIRFLAKVMPNYNRGVLEKAGIVVGAEAGQIVTLRVPVSQLQMLETNRDIIQYSIAHAIAGPMCSNTRQDTHADSVHVGKGVSNGTAYNGEGVYIGIADWGFDFLHPNLTNSDNNPRTVRVWDHYRNAGPAPVGFSYGTELSGQGIVDAEGDTAGLYGYGTHGTHVAGIAAGRGRGSRYIGMAYKANMLLCAFGLNEADYLDGVAWMRQVAAKDKKRLVVNNSWGMYSFSTLDGSSLLSQALDTWVDSGTVICVSAGNNGDVPFHIQRTFRVDTIDTLRTVAQYYTYSEEAIGQCLIMWGEEGNDFEACFRMATADKVWQSPMFSTQTDAIIYDTLLCDSIRIPYRALIEHRNIFDNRTHIQLDVDRDLGLQLQLFITAHEGTVHAWNVANKTNHAGNEGAAFTTGNHVGFVSGDAFYGISEPACASKVITVAAHHADHWNSTNTEFFIGDKANFTSSGPLIDGAQKPDISAPGYEVISSISSRTTGSYAAITSVTLGNGKRYIWSTLSGTSMSCPAVSGIIALMMQANPGISTEQVRDIITRTARNDQYTGDLLANDSASLHWGWGKIDALKAVNEAIRCVSINQAEVQHLPLHIYPNPATATATINTNCGEEQQMLIYTADGRCIAQQTVSTQATINLDSFAPGIYIVRVGNRAEKLIVK